MSEVVEGLDKLFAQFEEIENMDFVSAEVDAVNVFVVEAKALVPVDKGNLQETIRCDVEGEAVEFVAGGGSLPVDYAGYVEFGTINMAAQPYMRPSIDNKSNDAVRAAGKNLEAQMKRIAGNG